MHGKLSQQGHRIVVIDETHDFAVLLQRIQGARNGRVTEPAIDGTHVIW